ncbi:MAG: ATP-binding protein [Deltaproteobacteria bacterium]|nr:ATP-binding protein [Deltaproteobacteria bacterium]
MPEQSKPALDKNPKLINASPTKEFFIYMLTRDIPLTRAILDLIDNSVDGARRMRSNGNFNDLTIRVELDKNHFKIADNCGGIPVDIARNYAFRFGRPKDAPLTPGSVGQFGVGMKRTFFKLGRHFTVCSATMTSQFEMDIDVEQWKATDQAGKADDWHFEFKTVEEDLSDVPADKIGTRIEISELYESVAESFALDNFLTRLKNEMSLAHTLSIDKGLTITVNTIPLNNEPAKLFISDKLKPAFVEKIYQRELLDGKPGLPVTVKLFAGVAERILHEGGWYVFCNGRLVIRADQSAITIWGQAHDMRQYHPDFAYFRGYAYFDSDDATLLPWTTTKTGVDVDSPIYRSVQQEMIELSKPVLTFLSNLEKERAAVEKGDSTDKSLDQAIKSATAQRTETFQISTKFVAPQPNPIQAGPPMQKIQYTKPLSEVKKAMKRLNVHTYVAVGEKTFDYYMEYEGAE